MAGCLVRGMQPYDSYLRSVACPVLCLMGMMLVRKGCGVRVRQVIVSVMISARCRDSPRKFLATLWESTLLGSLAMFRRSSSHSRAACVEWLSLHGTITQ